ncbi:MAG: hypothetical protein GY849_08150 [Deltaproteobacteria bacterium]|nr:hypothetical protein [Deltaproteobacteria bacterium]
MKDKEGYPEMGNGNGSPEAGAPGDADDAVMGERDPDDDLPDQAWDVEDDDDYPPEEDPDLGERDPYDEAPYEDGDGEADDTPPAATWIDKLRKSRFLKVLLILGIVEFLCVLSFTLYYRAHKKQTVAGEKQKANDALHAVALKFAQHLNRVNPVVMQFANTMSQGNLSEEELGKLMKQIFDDNPGLLEVGAAFAPSLRKGKLYAPHYGMKGGKPQYFQVEKSYNYTEYDWYKATASSGPQWIEPYAGKATHVLATGYCAPFYDAGDGGKKRVAGVVRAAFSLTKIHRLLSELESGKTGYGFLVSRKGVIIAHPNSDRISETLSNSAKADKDADLLSLAARLSSAEKGLVSRVNRSSGRNEWIVYEKMPKLQWTLFLVLYPDELMQEYMMRHQHRKATLITGWLIFALWTAVFSYCLISLGGGRHVEWWVSSAFSVMILAGIGILWGEINKMSIHKHDAVLTDRDGIAKVLEDWNRKADKRNEPRPFRIPTGVFVQSLEFTSANNVTMSGYVWQKYDIEKHQGIKQGFIFPESFSSNVREAFRKKKGDEELVGWYFECVFRQPFNYKKYPFDHKSVWLRIWHNNFGKSIILTPDFDSYPLMTPTDLPGVECPNDFVLDGWTLEESYFEYQTRHPNISFGEAYKAGSLHYPELYFVVNIRRNFIDAFTTNLVPLIVVIFMLLWTLIMASSHPDRAHKFGSNPFAVLGASSALFFVVVVAHIQLRRQITVPVIMYLEYFYFITYLSILWVFNCSYMISSTKNIGFIQKNDGIWLKATFLPLILTTMYVITLRVFYF